MLQIQNLTLTHQKDLRTIIENFTFSLQPGDKAVIIGEEGNGKSTLLKWLYDPALIEGYAQASGTRLLEGSLLGYLPQELPEADKDKTVYEFYAQSAAFFDQTPRELARIAMQLSLPPEFFYLDQPVHSLSGGEKVKMQLARILMEKPDILLLDEPSGDIDIETLQWLETFIRDSPFPLLFISHDETLIENTANVIIHLEKLERGRSVRHTIARLSYRDYIQKRSAQLQKQTQLAYNEEREYRKQMDRFYHIQQQVEHDLRTITRQNPPGARLLKKKMKAVKSQERRFEREHENRTQVPHTELAIMIAFDPGTALPAGKCILDLSLDHLAVGERTLAPALSLRVMGREKICIVGRNGCGKSTLMKQIAAVLFPRTDLKVCYMPQNYEDQLDLSLSPLEWLAITGDKEELTQIRTHLGSMRYTPDEMFHPMRELSGGQKAKILLLKMILSKANVLLLDEPTRNFSPLSNPVIREVLSAFQGCVISISHDRKYIDEVADTVYELSPQGLLKRP
ncbi:MAG: ABC-F family ATP-binding cassette domain-containing protein [Lachnospiraceae bacterium]|nr:ABC-F family ATP-binding cassette domain-containing protein [Lachnospiraceae bacterium]